MEAEIINRVAGSGIETIDLGDYYPKGKIAVLDIKDWLFQGLILREKDFRQQAETHDWEQYKNAHVALYCSADAIIPVWAYMLLTTKLGPYTENIFFGNEEALLGQRYLHALSSLDAASYQDKRVVIKGCGDKEVPASAFVEVTRLLLPYAKSIMYGEPCSTVPVYKSRK